MARGKRPRGGGRREEFGNTRIVDSVRIGVNLTLKNFRLDENETEYEFPSSLQRTERAYVHKMAAEMGFKSKSRGKGQNRYITVYKNEGSTILAHDAVLKMSQNTVKFINNLVAVHPVSGKERGDLLPVNERTGSSGNRREQVLNIRNRGKLASGKPQVPERCGGREVMARRRELPIWPQRKDIMDTIRTNQVVLVTGDTGSGKTTQVPQFILEDAAQHQKPVNVVVCEPRRLAAVTVAQRVAQERGETLGQVVGYQIRLESCTSPQTLLTFCTYGVLLRSLMGGDHIAQSVTHIIIDEVHERDKLSDFLVTVLKDMLERQRNLKLILMSATVDTQQFLSYFPTCVQVPVPGRMFPVEEFFLEDCLVLTNYTNQEMRKQKKSKTTSVTGLSELTSRLSLDRKTGGGVEGRGADASGIVDTVEVEGDISADSGAAGPAKEGEDPDSDVVVEDSVTVDEALDNLIGKCFTIGSPEYLAELTSILESDLTRVDYHHSTTGVTPLMLAASRGLSDLIELCLVLGANPHLTALNGWTAIDFARETGQTAALQLLGDLVAKSENKSDAEKGEEETPVQITDEQRELLSLYQSSFDDEQVDHDLILSLVENIVCEQGPGGILVFLPGYEDIVNLRDLIVQSKKLTSSSILVLMLHSQMASADHKKAFQPSPGQRKVILSTNVAETGITLNDIVYVIDSGKVKEKTFDALSNVSMLKCDWISQSSAKQRKGRAGRCQPGKVFRLFSSIRFSHLPAYQTPEILRTPLLDLCLQTKLLAPASTQIADFLAKVPEPPAFLVTRNAVKSLKTLEALDFWEEVTPMGSHLLDLPLDPILGKILLHAVVLKCLDPVLTIVCCIAYRDPFQISADPQVKKQSDLARKRLSAGSHSDHMALLKAYQEWQAAVQEGRERVWCSRNLVSSSTMEMVKATKNQITSHLKLSGFLGPHTSDREVNLHSQNWAVVKACLVAGLYPNIARYDTEAGQFRTCKESKVRIHPGSVLVDYNKKGKGAELPTDWLVYNEMTRAGRSAYARGATLVSPLTVALFCGPSRLPAATWEVGDRMGQVNYYIEESSDSEEEGGEEEVEEEQEEVGQGTTVINLDPWIALRSSPDFAQKALQLRAKWSSLWLNRMTAALHKSTKVPDESENAVIDCLAAVLADEDEASGLQKLAAWNPGTAGNYPPVSYRPNSVDPDRRYHHMQQAGGRTARYADSVSSCEEGGYRQTSTPTKYFIVKPSSGSMTALEAAMSHGNSGVWSFPPSTERRLMVEIRKGYSILIFFSVTNSNCIQGCAIFTGQTLREGSRVGQQLEWVSRRGIALTRLQSLLSGGEKLGVGQDGQELREEVALQLVNIMTENDDSQRRVGGPGGFNRNRNRNRFNK